MTKTVGLGASKITNCPQHYLGLRVILKAKFNDFALTLSMTIDQVGLKLKQGWPKPDQVGLSP